MLIGCVKITISFLPLRKALSLIPVQNGFPVMDESSSLPARPVTAITNATILLLRLVVASMTCAER